MGCGGERAGTRGDARVRFAADVVELSLLILGVCTPGGRTDLLVAIEIAEVDVPVACTSPVIRPLRYRRREEHLGVFHLDGIPCHLCTVPSVSVVRDTTFPLATGRISALWPGGGGVGALGVILSAAPAHKISAAITVRRKEYVLLEDFS